MWFLFLDLALINVTLNNSFLVSTQFYHCKMKIFLKVLRVLALMNDPN